MSLITYTHLVELVDQGLVQKGTEDCVNPASVNIRLADEILVEDPHSHVGLVNLTKGQFPRLLKEKITEDKPYILYPQQFVLGSTIEYLDLPDDIAGQFCIRSSAARAGITNALAGWIDPGFQGNLTLEIANMFNHSATVLTPGMPLGQIYFLKGEPVPPHASYSNRGRYKGQLGVTPTKGL
jgi:dCTP deaminase